MEFEVVVLSLSAASSCLLLASTKRIKARDEFRGTRRLFGVLTALLLLAQVIVTATQIQFGIASTLHQPLFWFFTFILSLLRFQDERLYGHTTFLSTVPFFLDLYNTIYPLLRLPSISQPAYKYLTLSINVLLILLPLITPRLWAPVDPSNEEDTAAPEQTCTPISYWLTYFYVDYLVRLGQRRDVTMDDLPPLPDYDRAYLWKSKVMESQKSTTFRTLMYLMRWDLSKMAILGGLYAISQFLSPLAMQQLLNYLEHPKGAKINPYTWVIILFLSPIITTVPLQAYIFIATRLIVRTKSALTQLLYQKVLTMRIAEEDGASVGKINNLMSSDIDTIINARDFFLLVTALPIYTGVSMILLYRLMGWSAFVGFGFLIVTLPIPGFLAKRLAKLQAQSSEATDARLSGVNENMVSIRITKLFGWEEPRAESIRVLRKEEQRLIWKRNFVGIWIGIVTDLLPATNMLITFLVFTKVMDRSLTSSIAFTSISLFEILRTNFLWVGFMSRAIIQSFVSMRRIDSFLHSTSDLPPRLAEKCSRNGFENATFQWGSEGFKLRHITIGFIPGLNLVVGPTGSGKSSLLLALLGEVDLKEGSVFLDRLNGVAYVSQTAWLQNATIRENILFGSRFDSDRYRQVLSSCALLDDLALLNAGDMTQVGEKGVTLSGGQKQRLSLARAMYSAAKTVLLDDVLSALDGGTGKHVFEKGILGSLMQGRTIVLVTHSVALCSSRADNVVELMNGEANLRKSEFSIDLTQSTLRNEEPILADKGMASTVRMKGNNTGTLVANEESATGRISRLMMFTYIRDFGGPVFLIAMVITAVLYQALSIGSIFFIGVWADAYAPTENAEKADVDVNYYLGIYASIVFATALINGTCNIFFYRGAWKAAGKLHNDLLRSVFHAPLGWYDRQPVGRLINRFAKDIKALDSVIVPWLRMVVDNSLRIVVRIVSIASIMPLFAIPAVIVSVGGIALGEMYTKTQISVKRLVSVTESPLFSHFGDSIAGVVTIRAFGQETRFSIDTEKKIDYHTRPLSILYILNRWIQVRSDFLASIVAFTAALIALVKGDIAPGLVGFSLTNAIGFAQTLLYLVRTLNELEIELNSYERVQQYTHLEQEPEPTKEGQPQASWPTSGDVHVKDLTTRYSADGPDVLKNISFDIKSKEKIAVIGRTGSGKSTLGLSFLRFTHRVCGEILIDGKNVEAINLDALRRRVTIIPQDPILFSGTVRSNLDPFGDLDDSDLLLALRQCGISDDELLDSETSASAENSTESLVKKIGLDTTVTESGDNFSQGQRQILALARAVVRRSKLIILDEATASVDFATDERIQTALRTEFPDATLITIAHRLRTIMDYDRILVLDKGSLVEYDTPENLLNSEEGAFYKMVMNSDERDELLAISKRGFVAE